MNDRSEKIPPKYHKLCGIDSRRMRNVKRGLSLSPVNQICCRTSLRPSPDPAPGYRRPRAASSPPRKCRPCCLDSPNKDTHSASNRSTSSLGTATVGHAVCTERGFEPRDLKPVAVGKIQWLPDCGDARFSMVPLQQRQRCKAQFAGTESEPTAIGVHRCLFRIEARLELLCP